MEELAKDPTPDKAPEILSLLEQHGSLSYAKTRARHFTQEAQRHLAAFPACREKDYFQAITEELLNRTK